MKISGLKSNCIKAVALAVTALIFTGAMCSVQADELTARPLTPQEIHDNHLDGAIAVGGLFTVALGEPVYLDLLIESEPDAPNALDGSAMWYLTEAPSNSTAAIETSLVPLTMDIYSPPKREYMVVGDRMMLTPDVVGSYMVEVVYSTTLGGTNTLTAKITGAKYVGSGIVNDPAWTGPKYPQCALCHQWDPDGKVESFPMTGHFTFLEEAIDGIKSSHYSENCTDCHKLGGHNPNLNNGSFASTAAALGWTWPAVLQPGNWAAMPNELKNKANIQCEHCHGAGSEHHGDFSAISVSLNSGDCGQCHDEKPYHNKNRQWEISGHSRNPARTGGSCAGCHTAEGFINRYNGDVQYEIQGEAIVCAACHDPHSNENDNHQLRNTGDVTFENGHVVTAGGNGKACMNCHKARRNAEEYVVDSSMRSSFGPHYGIVGDLFNGTNAIEYDGKVVGSPSVHLYALEDSCAGCHMQAIGNSDPLKSLVGEHTFKVVAELEDGTKVPATGVCADCHGPLDSFDIKKYDYNYDGKTEGLQTEVRHLMDALAMKIHPVGSLEINKTDSNHVYTLAEKKAIYNWECVADDHSYGIHNPRYITEILRASIDDLGDPLNAVLGGINIPVGGAWYYSPWFDFYSPLAIPGWIYHVIHGYIHVDKDANGNLLIWDSNLDKWLYTNAELYPIMLDVENGTWLYFQGKFGDSRYFYNYGTGNWDIVE